MKTLKFKFLTKGEIRDYQSVLEEIIGMEISRLDAYDPNWDRKNFIDDVEIEKDRAYFVPDCDYEIIVRPIKKKK